MLLLLGNYTIEFLIKSIALFKSCSFVFNSNRSSGLAPFNISC